MPDRPPARRPRRRPGPALLPALALLLALAAPAALQAADCVTDSAGLRRILDLPAGQKSGMTVCLAPGRYTDLTPGDFAGAFIGLDPARPITFEAEDPARPPVLNMWLFSTGRGNQGENGDVILRDLAFDLTDDPLKQVGQNGFYGHRIGIQMGFDAVTRNVTLERIHVYGPLGNAREDGRETEHILHAVLGAQTRNVAIRDSRFENLLNGIAIAGETITIEGNRMRHSWGDLVRIVPQVKGGGGCADTVGVVVRNNILYDLWGNNRQHPDVVQMFAANSGICSVRDVLIEGNLAFPGRDAMQLPGFSTGFGNSAPRPAPADLPFQPRVLQRLTGPATSRLPAAVCPDKPVNLAVQLDGTSPGPVVLLPSPGNRLVMGRQPFPELRLQAPWATWRLLCRPDQQGTWFLVRQMAGLQGFFTNNLPGKAGYHDITIRNNILWTLGRAVDFRDPDNTGITVENNSLLRVWPGDLNGDGRPNTFDDGFHEQFPAAQIALPLRQDITASRNVATAPLKGGDRSNDVVMTHNDGGKATMQRFVTGPGPTLMPATPEEAVTLARPRPGGPLDGRGYGAVATRPADDPYDWSWVSKPW